MTHSLLLFLETSESLDFYCNKEHELISPERLIHGFRGSRWKKVIYNTHWLLYSGGVRI